LGKPIKEESKGSSSDIDSPYTPGIQMNMGPFVQVPSNQPANGKPAFANLANQMPGQQLEKRRRESSYTETLDDPLRYMELVKKQMEAETEEEDIKFVSKPPVRPPLENITEIEEAQTPTIDSRQDRGGL
jgi:hypothetical protein